MAKFSALILAVLMCLGVGNARALDAVTVRVAEFAPNYFKDGSGNWTGVSVELAAAIIAAAGYEGKFVELPWSRAMKYLREGELLYMTNLYKTDDRSAFLHWIGPVRREDMGLVVHRDYASLPITSLDDMVTVCREQGKRFGIQQDIFYSEVLARRIDANSEFRDCVESVSDVEFNLRKTVHKRILGFFESVPAMRYRLENDPAYADLVIHPFVLKTEAVFHGVSKQGVSPKMLEKLREGYTRCAADGTLHRILEKWKAR